VLKKVDGKEPCSSAMGRDFLSVNDANPEALPLGQHHDVIEMLLAQFAHDVLQAG
jgi:hypothetical protein